MADERSAAAMIQEIEFAPDSPLEEAGFELAVPRRIVTLILVFAYVTRNSRRHPCASGDPGETDCALPPGPAFAGTTG